MIEHRPFSWAGMPRSSQAPFAAHKSIICGQAGMRREPSGEQWYVWAHGCQTQNFRSDWYWLRLGRAADSTIIDRKALSEMALQMDPE